MATEFSRLYRELCHSGPNDHIHDLHFTRERKQVLKALGYDIKSKSDNFRRSKHHGKGARRRQLEARLAAISINADDARKKELAIRALSRKTSEVNELTNKIQGLLADNKFVSQNLWAKYDKIYGVHSEKKSDAVTRPKTIATPAMPRSKSTIRFDYSKNKWSKEEREKLNNIYWDLKKPSTKSVSAWENYFLEFASIFRIFFHERSETEVVAKIKDLYATRQFDEKGENEYWSRVQELSPQKVLLVEHAPPDSISPTKCANKVTLSSPSCAPLLNPAVANSSRGGLVQRVRSKSTR